MPEFSVKRGLQQFQATWILNSVFVDILAALLIWNPISKSSVGNVNKLDQFTIQNASSVLNKFHGFGIAICVFTRVILCGVQKGMFEVNIDF